MNFFCFGMYCCTVWYNIPLFIITFWCALGSENNILKIIHFNTYYRGRLLVSREYI